MLPPLLEIQRDGGVVGKGRKGAFGGIEHILILVANTPKLAQFLR
jgi:hypothetical protein